MVLWQDWVAPQVSQVINPHPPSIRHYFSWGSWCSWCSWCWSLLKLRLRLKLEQATIHITWSLRSKQPAVDSFKPADSLKVLVCLPSCLCPWTASLSRCVRKEPAQTLENSTQKTPVSEPNLRLSRCEAEVHTHIILHLTFEITDNYSDEKCSESFLWRKSAATLASHKPASVGVCVLSTLWWVIVLHLHEG